MRRTACDSAALSAHAIAAAQPSAVPRVLVVDDTPANVALLERLLRREGYAVVTAADGHEALAKVRTDSPDLVISDVLMPGCDGFQLCRALKSEPETRLLPIVLVTSARPYKSALPRDRALEGLAREVEKGWRDPTLVREFAALSVEEDCHAR